MTRRIYITGGTGLIGGALHRLLDGYEVHDVTRSPKKPGDVRWDPASASIDGHALEGAFAVIHLAGENVGQLWNAETKQKILNSRERGTSLIARTIAGLREPPKVFVSASAVGYYGDRGEQRLDEQAGPGEGFLADVCERWEAAAEPAKAAGVRLVHPRVGVVLAKHGGALEKMQLPFKMGLGGKIGSGEQYMSWIHIDDVALAIGFALRSEMQGPFNLSAPTPVTNAEFTKALGRALHRPTIFTVPRFAAKLGGEMADEMLLASQRAVPNALLEAGYGFRYGTIDAALDAIF